jgi:hypothetical protein
MLTTLTAVLVLSAGISTANLGAQVTLLTPREASELIELVPEVAAANKRGECVMLSPFGPAFDAGVYTVEARGSCWHEGDPSSLLVNNYTVDRRTGTITVYGSKSVVTSPAIRAKARGMLDLARNRLLSVTECRCLAREAAKSDFNLAVGKLSLALTDLTASDDAWRDFLAVGRNTADRISLAQQYSVSRETGSVWSMQREVLSAELSALRSRMLARRDTPALSLADVLAVALRIPSISAKMSTSCSEVEVDGTNSSADETFIAIRNSCAGGGGDPVNIAAVNVLTGAVSNPSTHAPLSPPEGDRVAHEILLRIANSRLSAQALIDAQCHISKEQRGQSNSSAGAKPVGAGIR